MFARLLTSRATTAAHGARRGYAAAAAAAVPLQLHGIEGRYATALFSAATKKNALKQVESELKAIEAQVAKDARLAAFMESPVLSRDAKKTGVQQMLAPARYSETTRNFFTLLAENGRLAQAAKIADSFHQLAAASRGEVAVTVTLARPADARTVDRVRSALIKGGLADSGHTLVMHSVVNPGIVGGLIIEIGDKTIDLSISARVSKLNQLLSESV